MTSADPNFAQDIPGPEATQATPLIGRRSMLGGAVGLGVGIAAFGAAARADAPSPATPTENLLTNPGFEQVDGDLPSTWESFSPDSAANIRPSTERVRSGARSVFIDDPSGSTTTGLRSAPVPVDAGTAIEASVYVFTEVGQSSFYLEFWNENGQRLWADFRINTFTGTWQRLDLRGNAPEQAVTATVLLYAPRSNVGGAHFDDATLHVPVPMEVTTYGPASLSAAVRGGVVLGGRVLISSRYNMPDGSLRLAEFDLASGELRSVDDLAITSTGGHRLATDGRYVYIGPAGSAHVWRFDPETKELSAWSEAGEPTTWYYAMAVDGDDLFVGTYPDCTVKRISLHDGSVHSYGRVSSSLYATTVAVDEEYVYGGSGAPGTLLRWPRDGGEPVDLTPHLSDSPVGILGLAVSNGLVHVASGRQIITIRPDGSDRVEREIADEDRYADYLAVAADGSVYAIARATSNVYRVANDGLEHVGRPLENVENQLLAVTDGGILAGASGIGHVWTLDPGGEAEVYSTATTEFGYPEVVQSLLLTRGQRLWVGGHFAMTVHHAPSGKNSRFEVNGEPKALAEGRTGTVYAALYPSAQVIAINPRDQEVTTLGALGHGQMRTRDMVADHERNQLLVASGPTGGDHTGALTLIDLVSGEFDVRRGILPEQSVMGVAVAGTTAYIVGDTYGESTGGPIRDAAQVAAFDLNRRDILWRKVLRPDWLSYEDVYWSNGLLYFMARRPRGHWFAYDPTTEQVTMEGDLGGYGSFGGADGNVFAWTHFTDAIRQLPSPNGADGGLLHSSVPVGWYNNPQFNLTPNRKATWGMHGTDLALFELPRHT